MEKRAIHRGFRPVVYVCSPYRGDIGRNTENARRNCRFAVKKGAIEYLKAQIVTSNHELSGSPKASPAYRLFIEEQTVRILDLEMAIGQDEKALSNARSEITAAISGINNDNLATILQMRYLDYMQWEDIMASLDYCRSYLYELHGRALRAARQCQRG